MPKIRVYNNDMCIKGLNTSLHRIKENIQSFAETGGLLPDQKAVMKSNDINISDSIPANS